MTNKERSARSGSTRADGTAPTALAAQRGLFCKEGEFWTVGYDGRTFRLKDSKGLGYLAHLLRHPSVEFHVLDLVGGIASQGDQDETDQEARGLPRADEELERAGIHVARLGDAGAMLDDQARVAYRRRLSDLREELEAAKELGNVERAERAEREIDALTRELSRAVGLGGRNRRAASASERARQAVTKTIRAVLGRIGESDATLGGILSRCIRTGTFCCYRPEPDFPIAWEFAATLSVSAAQSNSRGDAASPGADHRVAPPVALGISPFPFAERTAFVGRETERRAIRAAIDLARSGHGSLVMLRGGPGIGKTRLAKEVAEYASRIGFRCCVGHCYERNEPFPYLPFVEIIESNLAEAASREDFRSRLGENAPELAQIAPAFDEFFRISRNHLTCRQHSTGAIFFRALPRPWGAPPKAVHTCLFWTTFIGPTSHRWRF
jgi:hypothetical protein